MRIDTNVPLTPAVATTQAPPAPATAQSFNSTANAAALAVQLEEEKHGGGGGGGGHHGAKKALSSIDEIAARNSLNIEERKKTMLERQREIEKLKAEMAGQDQEVGEKQPGSDDERPGGQQPQPENEPDG